MSVEIGQVITQIISFLLMFWILKKFAWKPLLNSLEERKEKIKSDFNAAELEMKNAEMLKKTYHEKLKGIEAEARTKIQEAVVNGLKEAHKIQKDAHSDAKKIITQAQEEIQREVHKARKQLKNDMVNMTVLATEKVLKSSLTKEEQQRIVADFEKHAEFN